MANINLYPITNSGSVAVTGTLSSRMLPQLFALPYEKAYRRTKRPRVPSALPSILDVLDSKTLNLQHTEVDPRTGCPVSVPKGYQELLTMFATLPGKSVTTL